MSRRHRSRRSGSSKTSRSDITVSSILEDISEDNLEGPKYEIKTSKVMGRYIVSTKDIRPGEVIISEEPLVVGPCTDCKVQCLGCYKDLEKDNKIVRCANCGWPLCSKNCPGLKTNHGHTKIECTILQECKSALFFNYEDLKSLRIHFQAIVPLRCLILKTTDPSNYNILMDMESHNDIRRNIPDLWSLNQIRVVDRIIKDWKLTEFTEDEVHTICGILEVAFSVIMLSYPEHAELISISLLYTICGILERLMHWIGETEKRYSSVEKGAVFCHSYRPSRSCMFYVPNNPPKLRMNNFEVAFSVIMLSYPEHAELMSISLLYTICGILEVNAFEIGQQGVSIRGLYPTSFLLSHDCVPNTNHTDEEDTYRLTIRASTKIPEGHPITLSYAYTLQCTQKRREHLMENKFFECRCKRCSDPTELGTYLSAVVCPKCENGLVLCDNPLNFDSSWSCRNSRKNCRGYSITAKSMKLLLNRVSQEVEQIDCNDVQSMELFLHKYRNVLHTSHYLCLGVKVSLSQIYGRISGYLIHELNEKTLMRKREICKEILRVFDVIEPGYTRIRGVTLYEIHAPMMILLSRQMESQPMSKSEVKSALKEVLKYLVEASVILSYEPEHSPEGIMGKAAKDALVQIKDWEKIVGKLK